MKRSLFILFSLLLFAGSISAQQYRKDEEDDPNSRAQKVGVRIGIGNYWLQAPEMKKGNPLIGVQGAMYYRIAFGKRFDLNVELGANYKGSKFPINANDTGQVYSRLGLFYGEMPILGMISLDKKKQHILMLGPTVSYLIKPSLFIGSTYISSYYPTFTTLPLKRLEFAATLGYMFSSEYIGLYIGYKHGLTNIAGDFANANIPRDSGNAAPRTLNDVSPSLSGVKSIFNRSIELSLYF
ncbi:MAG: PorT family protein [Bacteroidota bacterium]|nr:PorT family protein [Bacteroidota bacterium]MDX5431202.1 PorT family protein [Bacteroidota bacterium]MDX5469941.1 PorT family protein [Bacteroidota bacterium]